jgi:hypothetical protein
MSVAATLVGEALLLALANAAHCAGMCGVFAGHAARGGGRGLSAYLAGKTATYVTLGVLAGAAGAQALALSRAAQPWLALLAGTALLSGLCALQPSRAGAAGRRLRTALAPARRCAGPTCPADASPSAWRAAPSCGRRAGAAPTSTGHWRRRGVHASASARRPRSLAGWVAGAAPDGCLCARPARSCWRAPG